MIHRFKGSGALVIVVIIVKFSAFSTLHIFHTPHFLHSAPRLFHLTLISVINLGSSRFTSHEE